MYDTICLSGDLVTRMRYVVFEFCSGSDLFNFLVTGPFEKMKRYIYQYLVLFSLFSYNNLYIEHTMIYMYLYMYIPTR